MIRQTTNGNLASAASDWGDVIALLQAELSDPHGDLSIEESVIRASIKAIPVKFQKQVTRLFTSFALCPEDTHVPLDVLGLMYDACEGGSATTSSSTNAAKATPHSIARLQVRKYLKVLLDRSLVLGTVDRPQLHDVMLEYVQKELAGDAYKAAQRRLVELFRNGDRSTASSGKPTDHTRTYRLWQHIIVALPFLGLFSSNGVAMELHDVTKVLVSISGSMESTTSAKLTTLCGQLAIKQSVGWKTMSTECKTQ